MTFDKIEKSEIELKVESRCTAIQKCILKVETALKN